MENVHHAGAGPATVQGAAHRRLATTAEMQQAVRDHLGSDKAVVPERSIARSYSNLEEHLAIESAKIDASADLTPAIEAASTLAPGESITFHRLLTFPSLQPAIELLQLHARTAQLFADRFTPLTAAGYTENQASLSYCVPGSDVKVITKASLVPHHLDDIERAIMHETTLYRDHAQNS